MPAPQRNGRGERAKKKLTDDELFAYDLCRDIGCPHPDLLPLTWEQFRGWQRAHNQRPWGEPRADLRAQANTLWAALIGSVGSSDLPDLAWPYYEDTETIGERIDWMEKNKERLLSDAKDKLLEMRRRARGR